jgi:hypothetical protein
MRESDDMILQHYGDYVTNALRTEGGHLSIARGGFTLHFGRGARLSGYDCESFKACCIGAGLPVIDSRMVASKTSCASRSVDRWWRSAKRQARHPIMRSLSPRSVSWRRPTGRPALRSSTSRTSRAPRRESERKAGRFVTGWRSREGSWPPVAENRYGFRSENHAERLA